MNEIKAMWNARYAAKNYAYGTQPNNFFKNSLDRYPISGEILMPAEGEGRNAVYAAKKGLKVLAFDISEEGKKKALNLANREQVSIDYQVVDFLELALDKERFDAVGLIFAHFPPALLSSYHEKIIDLLKPGGLVILEGFSTNHVAYRTVNPKVGGPANIDFLFSESMIKRDFADFETINLEEREVELHEGEFHIGTGKVIRFLGKKRG